MPKSIFSNGVVVRASRADQWRAEAGAPRWSRSQRVICSGKIPELSFPRRGDLHTKARSARAHRPFRPDRPQPTNRPDEFGIWGELDREQHRTTMLQLATNCANEEPLFFPEEEGA
jgi:hypothetical protein